MAKKKKKDDGTMWIILAIGALILTQKRQPQPIKPSQLPSLPSQSNQSSAVNGIRKKMAVPRFS